MEKLRVCLLGCKGVGKTSLVIRLVGGRFVEEYEPTMGEDYRKIMEGEGGEPVLVDFLDGDGDMEFRALWDEWIHMSDAFLILYSVGDFESFEKVRVFLERVFWAKDTGDVAIVVVGHKSDLGEEDRAVDKKEGEEYVGLHEGVLFMEVSAKIGENVSKVFEMVIKRYQELQRKRMVGKGEERIEESPPPVVHDVQKGKLVKRAQR